MGKNDYVALGHSTLNFLYSRNNNNIMSMGDSKIDSNSIISTKSKILGLSFGAL